ncbi:MAG: HPr family phosphocarrier protein [Spirochaetes bacterium]|nr:HPr family phosphocarrier protein [Spirochaetota bacterium]
MVTREITIKNESGLHARPAAIIVQKANAFKSDIFLEKEGDRVNAKSIMGVMMLAAAFGTTVKVIAEGEDEEKAVDAIAALLESDIDSEVKS